MKKILLLFFLNLTIFNIFGYSQEKTLNDKNAHFFYNYILDSVVKMDSNPMNLRDGAKLNISRYTIDYPLNKVLDYSVPDRVNCLNTLYQILRSDKFVDSNEILNLSNSRKILVKAYFDSSKYSLVEKDDIISFTEPLYFSNKKYAIISCAVFRGSDGIYIFKRNRRKWNYLRAICEVVY